MRLLPKWSEKSDGSVGPQPTVLDRTEGYVSDGNVSVLFLMPKLRFPLSERREWSYFRLRGPAPKLRRGFERTAAPVLITAVRLKDYEDAGGAAT